MVKDLDIIGLISPNMSISNKSMIWYIMVWQKNWYWTRKYCVHGGIWYYSAKIENFFGHKCGIKILQADFITFFDETGYNASQKKMKNKVDRNLHFNMVQFWKIKVQQLIIDLPFYHSLLLLVNLWFVLLYSKEGWRIHQLIIQCKLMFVFNQIWIRM